MEATRQVIHVIASVFGRHWPSQTPAKTGTYPIRPLQSSDIHDRLESLVQRRARH